VELSAIETPAVENAMVDFRKILTNIQDNNFNKFKQRQQELKNENYDIAQAIKLSSNAWELPSTLKKYMPVQENNSR